ncbi:MAG: hypothetical protein H0Z37_08280 [Firmicutes bacterium]|nr:hypothetical protein [Bacillota bacterium]
MSLLQDGFWKDYLLAVAATILVGALVASSAAHGLDAALDRAADGILGEAGQYDLIVHIRQDYREAAARELPLVLSGHYEGVRVERAITVAGNANFLIDVPAEHYRADVLESLPSLLGQIPGFNGYTWLLEPSLTVTGLRPGVRDRLAGEAAAVPGVRLAVRHGSSVTVVLEEVQDQSRVADALNRLLSGRQLVELGFPPGEGPVDGTEVAASVKDAVGARFAADVTPDGGEDGAPAGLDGLRRFLESFGSRVRIAPVPGSEPPLVGQRLVLQGGSPERPVPGKPPAADHVIVEITHRDGDVAVGRIEQGDRSEIPDTAAATAADGSSDGRREAMPAYRLDQGFVGPLAGTAAVEEPGWNPGDPESGALLWHRVGELARAAAEAAGQVDRWLVLVGPADGTGAVAGETGEATRELAQRLVKSLRSGDGAGAVRETLLTVIMAALAQNAKPDGDGAGSGAPGIPEALSPDRLAALRDSLNRLAEAAGQLQGDEWQDALRSMPEIGALLPELRDDELTRILQALEEWTGAAGGHGPRIELWIDASVPAEEIRRAAEEATGRAVTVRPSASGVVSPSPRSLVTGVLDDVRRSVAALLAFLVAALSLILDHAIVLAAMRYLSVPDTAIRPAGAAIGALLLGAVYGLSGARLPFAGHWAVLAAGALLGLLTAALAERLGPVNAEEIVAGQSLGLSDGQIMREIVVPAGRPGMMVLVNRRRRRFR